MTAGEKDTVLMRDNLCEIIQKIDSAHAGLLMQRGLRKWEEGEKPTKKALIDTIASVKPNELYLLAFNRWLGATFNKPTFATASASIDGRLFTGLALGGTLETGVMTHHAYGMPMIAGSSVKGAVRSYVEHLFAKRNENNQIKYDKDGQVIVQDDKKPILDILFGADSDDDNASAGYLIWHDAWWIPKVSSKMELSADNQPFVGEVVTVHHQKDYQGEWVEAWDIESPVPNQQIAVQGDFYFCIEGDNDWAEFAKDLLDRMLKEQGLGAKGSNGYGYFISDKKLDGDIEKRYQNSKPIDPTNPLALIKKEISILDDEQLVEKLSKGINKFFNDLQFNKEDESDCRKVVQVLVEERSDFIDKLSNETGKNAQKAYKFIEKYR
ncbi:type III-B CRISPR module RAMP protein Cmr6 [Moraxella cuniculi]|uniref:CRISPR type III-B/RAMP module RAMP protein Cmr6 n=1 Tax=Moraxella cuniculi TaxID=34061 RepID=A0A448GTT3_9GAMM|nr:type III-B CRISPR module RAMP protein Cmr6 [Moraxella cuniculi]VEG12220.1 CRISPR type III-B/RAMP module RAMP protein Cmr6 [Moraxella cuniculi]